jgi:hypothetical protein
MATEKRKRTSTRGAEEKIPWTSFFQETRRRKKGRRSATVEIR